MKIIKSLQDGNLEIYQRGIFLGKQIIIMFKLFIDCYNITLKITYDVTAICIMIVILYFVGKSTKEMKVKLSYDI